MGKKGFTLVELVVTIAIMLLIAGIAVPSTISTLKKSKDKEYGNYIEIFKEAANQYFIDEGVTILNGCFKITLDTLKDNGYIPEIPENPKTKTTFSGVIEIDYNGGKLKFEYKDNSICSSNIADLLPDDISDETPINISDIEPPNIINSEINIDIPEIVKELLRKGNTLYIDSARGKSGIYRDKDDFGSTYYFYGSGNYIKNVVNFGGKTWKILRINGDGTMRLVLNDVIDIDHGSKTWQAPDNTAKLDEKDSNGKYKYYLYKNNGYGPWTNGDELDNDDFLTTVNSVSDSDYSNATNFKNVNTNYSENIKKANAIFDYKYDNQIDQKDKKFNTFITEQNSYSINNRLSKWFSKEVSITEANNVVNNGYFCEESDGRLYYNHYIYKPITNFECQKGNGKLINTNDYGVGQMTKADVEMAGLTEFGNSSFIYINGKQYELSTRDLVVQKEKCKTVGKSVKYNDCVNPSDGQIMNEYAIGISFYKVNGTNINSYTKDVADPINTFANYNESKNGRFPKMDKFSFYTYSNNPDYSTNVKYKDRSLTIGLDITSSHPWNDDMITINFWVYYHTLHYYNNGVETSYVEKQNLRNAFLPLTIYVKNDYFRPVINLSSNVKISSGEGTDDNPFQLSFS